jgi:hypothetical protein
MTEAQPTTNEQSICLSQYAAMLGRKGGSVKSERKTLANRKNGKLGGRPKKEQPQTVAA